MGDEFIKGLAALTGGLLGWMVFAGWYNTGGFESRQLTAPGPESVELYGTIALVLKETLFWFAIVGALTFWVLIPAGRQARAAWADRRSN